MRWIALNGSPRGRGSNSTVMLSRVREGMEASGSVEWEEILLNRTGEAAHIVEQLSEADGIILIYPLYTDSMPAIVVNFLEVLRTGKLKTEVFPKNPIPAAFIVHSGFTEGIHTAHLPELHRLLCDRTGLRYAGTLRKPGSEGIRLMTPSMLKSTFEVLRRTGASLVQNGYIVSELENKLVKRQRLGGFERFALRAGSRLGLTNFYWNRMLKKNGAFADRFEAPYLE